MARSRLSGDFTTETNADAGGLGNLADELADAWDEDEEDGDVSGFQEYQGNEENQENDTGYIESLQNLGPQVRPSTPSQASDSSDERRIWAGSRAKGRAKRRDEPRYDGSEYGWGSDFEEAGLSPNLLSKIDEIQDLVRWGDINSQHTGGDVIASLIECLKDLGAQSGVENNATRLITAHASLTSHLAHQTRTLQTLTHPLLFSHFPILSADAIDDLIPLIDDLLLRLPYPVVPRRLSTASTISASSGQQQMHPQSPFAIQAIDAGPEADALLSLQTLLSQTSDLTHFLRSLSDTLHESRQLTSTASRRLKSVRGLVAEIRREEEDRDEGVMFIEKGQWDKRLSQREAGTACRDVVSGFEAVCGEWRNRLFGVQGQKVTAAAT